MTSTPLRPPAEPCRALARGVRIRDVARMTGLSTEVLRAWERRYGVPSPPRTEGRFRVFGTRELAEVREMVRLCDRGLSTAQAARVVRAQREAGHAIAPGELPELDHDAHRLAAWAIVDAVTRFADADLASIVDGAMRLGTAVEVVEGVFQPALVSLAGLERSGALGVANERLANHVLGSKLREIAGTLSVLASGPPGLLACFEDERDELDLLCFAIGLSDAGLRPVVLGARTPPSALAAAIASTPPAFVLTTIAHSPNVDRALHQCEAYADACRGLPWFVGGRGAGPIAGHAEALGARMVGTSLGALRHAVSPLVARAKHDMVFVTARREQ